MQVCDETFRLMTRKTTNKTIERILFRDTIKNDANEGDHKVWTTIV